MDFYYDSVVGLQYLFYGDNTSVFKINTAIIPNDFDLEKAMFLMKQQGVFIIDSAIDINPIEIFPKITSNSIL